MATRRWFWVLVCLVLVTGCDKIKEKVSGGSAEGGAAATGTAKSAGGTATAPAPKQEEENLLSVASGAMIVEEPTSGTTNYDPWYLLDDAPKSFWQNNTPGTHTLLIALPQRTQLSRLLWQGAAAKVTVEVSDAASGKDGFQKVGEASLTQVKFNHSSGEGQLQPIPIKEAPARWVRLKVENTEQSSQNNELRGYGKKLEDPPWTTDFSGTYGPMTESLGDLRIRRDANGVSGCVASWIFSGNVEGHLVKLTWRNVNSATEKGPALVNVSPDGRRLVFMRYPEGGTSLFTYTGPKKAATVGATDCPQWKEEAKVDPLAAELEKQGRVRLHGIRFDTDSDVIRSEGKPLLDRVAAMLKAKPDLKLAIEGHTDNTATPAYNQTLSEKRAKAVEKYIEDKGVDGKRLTPVGLGQTKPIAPNENSIGRSENRRVELVKQ